MTLARKLKEEVQLRNFRRELAAPHYSAQNIDPYPELNPRVVHRGLEARCSIGIVWSDSGDTLSIHLQ